MTQDADFFVHCGAAGALYAASFWFEQSFLEQLKEARKNGVRRVICAGHSVGGMYAALLFYSFWKKLDEASQDVLSLLSGLDVQCVTFGSPMVFGGSSQQAREFKDFARKRAVNYINEDDPCPRAWSAINLQQFVKTAAKSVQNGPVDEVAGLVASQVVAAAAQEVVKRQDFHLLEDFARRYQHFAELKVLSSERQINHWKEFQLTPDCLNDHAMGAYVNRLFDAFDDSRPECHIHSQTARVEQRGGA